MKKILFLSNFSLANTGFGKAQKNLLSRLYKTGKYELAELAAGISDNDTNSQRVPWKVYGVLPKTSEEAARFNTADENLKRAFSYGLFRFDEAVADFKPDIVVCHEDMWAWSGWLKGARTYGKFIPVAWHPFDASPMTEEFSAFLKDFKYIYTYGEWSKEIGVVAGLPQTEVATLGVDANTFTPLSNRSELRLKNNINPEDYVVLMVARLQVRKRFETLFESLLDMQKNHPELYKRVKILPYCNITDPAGFDVLKFWRSRKIPTEKIIIPYFCSNCREYHIAPSYVGEKAPCPHCGLKDSAHTPSVVDGLTDTQLNEVYNISDLFVLPTSNEGYGLPLCEAKATEKITISTGYSTSNEITIGNNSGLAFDFSKYVEYGTLFYKANLTSEEVAKKINIVFDLPEEEKVAMGKRARELVLTKYNWDILAREWEARLDAMQVQAVDWDAKPKQKTPNPEAKLPETQNLTDWLVALYKNVLDTDILQETNNNPMESQGVKYWLWEMDTNKRPKDDVEKFFRETAKKEVAEKQTVTLQELLDPTDTKRLLYVIPRSAGDNFLSTAVVGGVKEKYPNHSIYVACEPAFLDIWKNNPNIKRAIPFHESMMMYGAMEGTFNKGLFDICFMPTILTQREPPAWHHNAKTKSFLI